MQMAAKKVVSLRVAFPLVIALLALVVNGKGNVLLERAGRPPEPQSGAVFVESVRRGELQSVETFLKAGADPNTTDPTDKDSWEVLEIEYSDNNPSPKIGMERNLKGLKDKFNR